MRRAITGAAALLALLVPVASAGAAGSPGTVVDKVTPSGSHSVRVELKAAGDLDASQVAAQLGGKAALITGVRRSGPARPLHLVLAIDTSGSMAGSPITAAIAAGQRLLEAVGKGDEVGLVVFDDQAHVVAPRSANIDAVRNALGSISTAQGTALYDGVLQAARMTAGNPNAERVVVVLSDGADTSSRAKLADVLSTLARTPVEIEAVGLTSSGSFTDDALRRITAATGGRYVSTDSTAGLRADHGPAGPAAALDRLRRRHLPAPHHRPHPGRVGEGRAAGPPVASHRRLRRQLRVLAHARALGACWRSASARCW